MSRPTTTELGGGGDWGEKGWGEKGWGNQGEEVRQAGGGGVGEGGNACVVFWSTSSLRKIIRPLNLNPTHISFGWLQLLIHSWSVALSRIDSWWKKSAYLRGTKTLAKFWSSPYNKKQKSTLSLHFLVGWIYCYDNSETRDNPSNPILNLYARNAKPVWNDIQHSQSHRRKYITCRSKNRNV
jgi:hypothetical protein